MNTVFLSPHFPPNFRNFCIQLRQAGANVLGLADEGYESLNPELRASLTDYYRVWDMHNYDELVRALGFLTHRHGKLDRIDSHNEYWLETEARLRTDFNIAGIKLDEVHRIKRKSEMKKVFLQAGLKPARGRVCHTEDELRGLIDELGLPVVAKPDVGVGAARTYKLESEEDVKNYLVDKPPVDYIVEEFIGARIVTYDGLAGADGDPVFSSSLRYSKGVMEAVNEDSDLYYYTVREIEPLLEEAGLRTLRAFDVRERFFHFEFFLTASGEALPLEVNIRPPGGLTLDMFNYMFDFNCYRIWADMVVHGATPEVGERLYFVLYVGRKDHISYLLSHNEVIERFQPLIIHHERISGVFARAIGHYGYILRAPELDVLIEAAGEIQKSSTF